MKEEGADVIVALAHTGFDAGVSLKDHDAENAVLPLSLVPGIDAIAFSHTHRTFPARDFASLDASSKQRGRNAAAGGRLAGGDHQRIAGGAGRL
ncbi:hypothetical protein VQ056_15480 [Paenibacillus sp. JTLBN-2024]